MKPKIPSSNSKDIPFFNQESDDEDIATILTTYENKRRGVKTASRPRLTSLTNSEPTPETMFVLDRGLAEYLNVTSDSDSESCPDEASDLYQIFDKPVNVLPENPTSLINNSSDDEITFQTNRVPIAFSDSSSDEMNSNPVVNLTEEHTSSDSNLNPVVCIESGDKVEFQISADKVLNWPEFTIDRKPSRKAEVQSDIAAEGSEEEFVSMDGLSSEETIDLFEDAHENFTVPLDQTSQESSGLENNNQTCDESTISFSTIKVEPIELVEHNVETTQCSLSKPEILDEETIVTKTVKKRKKSKTKEMSKKPDALQTKTEKMTSKWLESKPPLLSFQQESTHIDPSSHEIIKPTKFTEQAKTFFKSADTANQQIQDQMMANAAVTEDFEKKHAVPPYTLTKRAEKKLRKAEKKSSTGDGWFGMKAPEMTEELKNDVEILQMRNLVNERIGGYKKSDYKNGPKYFQVATVEESPLDFYVDRVPKKQRKRTMVDELLADADFRKRNKKMFSKVQEKMRQRQGFRKTKKKRHGANRIVQ